MTFELGFEQGSGPEVMALLLQAQVRCGKLSDLDLDKEVVSADNSLAKLQKPRESTPLLLAPQYPCHHSTHEHRYAKDDCRNDPKGGREPVGYSVLTRLAGRIYATGCSHVVLCRLNAAAAEDALELGPASSLDISPTWMKVVVQMKATVKAVKTRGGEVGVCHGSGVDAQAKANSHEIIPWQPEVLCGQ